MNRNFKRIFLPALFLFAFGAAMGMQHDGSSGKDDTFKQLRKLEDAFLLINREYVEEVKPEKLAESAVKAMLKDLDPHSTYIDARHVPSVQDEYQGSFGGIGVWFEIPPEDTARVTSTFPDGPSESVGILAGDRMVAADGESLIGIGSLGIQNKLKGPVGTHVKVAVIRPGLSTPLDFDITRARIPLYSIDASYMIDVETGYIRIGRFSMTTRQEFVEHVQKLKAKGLQRLVLDLRNNPGGIKAAAVGVVDEMLDGEGIVVSTRGRDKSENEVDRGTPGGVLTEEPVIVLVDEYSASGSEIVAGALQDHDRALIVGRRTFGKGLVQRPFQLSDGSILQMTVARYYMPSGRLIQTPYENGDQEAYYKTKFSKFEEATVHPGAYLEELPDSLKFFTDHGRPVYGGGGVMPDVVVPPDTLSELSQAAVREVLRKGIAFLFVRSVFDGGSETPAGKWDNRRAEFLDEFEVPEDLWRRFESYALDSVDGSESTIDRTSIERYRAVLKTILKARIAQRLYRSEAWWPVFNTIDPTVQSALGLWKSAESLSAYHRSTAKTSPGKDS